MIKLGGWNVNVSTSGMPQKIASVMGNGFLTVNSCEYKFIATLGTQQVNGTNTAILAQQTVLTGKDVNNATVLVFNEKPGSMDVALVETRVIVESGGAFGGISVNMSTMIPEEADEAFKAALEGFTGSKIEPFAFIGTQVSKGVNYILAAKVTATALGASPDLAIVTVRPLLEPKLEFRRMLDKGVNDIEESKLGYAFTWLS